MKRYATLCTVLVVCLALVGCATTTGGLSPLQQIQSDLQKVYTKTFGQVNADAKATLQTIAAQQAAGLITAAGAAQRSQCPTNVLGLGTTIQSLIGVPVPDGAGILWLLDEVNSFNQTQLNTLRTQVKLVVGVCQAMVKGIGIL